MVKPIKTDYVKTPLEKILEYCNADGSIRFDKNLLVLLRMDNLESKFKNDIWLCILVLAILQKDFGKE